MHKIHWSEIQQQKSVCRNDRINDYIIIRIMTLKHFVYWIQDVFLFCFFNSSVNLQDVWHFSNTTDSSVLWVSLHLVAQFLSSYLQKMLQAKTRHVWLMSGQFRVESLSHCNWTALDFTRNRLRPLHWDALGPAVNYKPTLSL